MIPEPLTQLLAPDRWPAFVMITARLSGLMLTAPLWSMSTLPRTARAAVTVVLAAALLPAAPAVRLPDGLLELPLPFALEMVVGLVIGLVAAVVVQGVTLGGEVIALQMGLALAPQLAPLPELQVPSIGALQGNMALLIYVGIGGHLVLLRGLADSLQALPPGQPMDMAAGGRNAALAMGAVFECGVRAAAPVIVTLLLANVAIAFLSRAVPQINTMMVSFPITIALGLVMFGAALPFVASTIQGWMQALPGGVDSVVGALRPAPAGP